jgi:hypothetical protein
MVALVHLTLVVVVVVAALSLQVAVQAQMVAVTHLQAQPLTAVLVVAPLGKVLLATAVLASALLSIGHKE